MTATDRPLQTFAITVATNSREAGRDTYVLELDIPVFDSNYPTKITRVDRDMARLLSPGTSHNIVLERQNLKQGKGGQRRYDYYYGLIRIALPGDDDGPPLPEGELEESGLFPPIGGEAPPMPQRPPERARGAPPSTASDREAGIVWGALGHDAAQVLAAWVMNQGRPPDEGEEAALLLAYYSIREKMFTAKRG